jgi:hypothetical protein
VATRVLQPDSLRLAGGALASAEVTELGLGDPSGFVTEGGPPGL